jgi:hypothetical protein
MGYEIIYKYKESADSPGSYSEEIKEKSVKIGKVTDEVGLDAVAAKVMTQLARRNILIVDVEIYEYAKKKVSYRETPTGIVIKNKKFSFDSGSIVETGDFEEEAEKQEDFKPIPSPSRELADSSCPIAKKMHIQPQFKRVMRHEIFEPEPLALHKAQQKGLKFTVGKKYPIYSETSLGTTIVYKTTDDRGKDVDVSSEYFMAVGAGLMEQDSGPTYVGAENQKEEINLWRSYESVDMPDIRRK